jgi:hypothetical protein
VVDKALEVAGWVPPGSTYSGSDGDTRGSNQNCSSLGGEVLLAELWYDINGKRTQVAGVLGSGDGSAEPAHIGDESAQGVTGLWKTVKVAVRSNHGHPDYTCLHRISVLGESVTALLRGGDR